MFRRKVFFEGTKDRLHRFIQRQNGKLLNDQKFTVVYKMKTKHGAYSQHIRGQYKKTENGYDIQYFVLPTIWNLLVLLFIMAIVGIADYYTQEDITAWYIMIVFFSVLGYFRHRSKCIQLFEADCKK